MSNIDKEDLGVKIVEVIKTIFDPETGETIYVFRNIGTHKDYRRP